MTKGVKRSRGQGVKGKFFFLSLEPSNPRTLKPLIKTAHGSWLMAHGSWLLAVWLFLTVPAFPKKSTLKEQQHRLKTIQKLMETKQNTLRKVKKKEKKFATLLVTTQKRLELTQNELHKVTNTLNVLEDQKKTVEEKLFILKKQFRRGQETLSLRLIQTYKFGEIKYVEVLLGSQDVWDFLNRLDFLTRIVRRDVTLVSSVKAVKDRVEMQEILLSKKVRRISEVKHEISLKKRAHATAIQQQAHILGELRQKRAAYEQSLRELEQTSRAIESWIRRYIASHPSSLIFKGAFRYPVAGAKITSRFGYRRHPIFGITKMHTGVDFGVKYGAPVYAAASGVVIYSGWFGGYGKVVMIGHGSGLVTLYAHCSRLVARENQTVKKGQLIAYVGSTGISTGPHLHFEVRKNGKPVNPLR